MMTLLNLLLTISIFALILIMMFPLRKHIPITLIEIHISVNCTLLIRNTYFGYLYTSTANRIEV